MTSNNIEEISAVLEPHDVLQAWFQDEQTGRMDLPQLKRWFRGGKNLDAHLKATFSETLRSAADGKLEHWFNDRKGALALIVLLDQMNRNINRGTAKAFDLDARALVVAKHALKHDYPSQPPFTQRMFCYMPFEHDETVESQIHSVTLFQQLKKDAPEEFTEFAERVLASAVEHRDIIENFGRYPHRNKVLGRQSTEHELQWLNSGSKRFGQ